MNILVVGGAGFIGHHVVHALKIRSHNVSVFDNQTSYGGLIDHSELAFLKTERETYADMKVWNGDITNINAVEAAYKESNPDVIIHLAGLPNARMVKAKPTLAAEVMIQGTDNLLKAYCSNVNRRFVFISSSMVYGDFDAGVKETAKTSPSTLYASYKVAGEQMTKLYAEQLGFDYAIVRPSAVYGPRDIKDRVISKFMHQALANEPLNVYGRHEKLDFSFVSDVAEGIAKVAVMPNAKNETFNISLGYSENILSVADHIRQLGNSKVIVHDRDKDMPSRSSLCIQKAKQLIGYAPQVHIIEGIRIYNDWIQNSILRN